MESNFLRRLLEAIAEERIAHETDAAACDEREIDPIGCPSFNAAFSSLEVDERARPAAAQQPSSAPRPLGILLADDEEAICFCLDRELRRRGMAVFVASDGLQALDLLMAYPGRIDAVFLDVRMPRLDGPQTRARIRLLDPGIRCCFMTAHGKAACQSWAEDGLAPPEVLEKPFGLEGFLAALDRLLAGTSVRHLIQNPPNDKQTGEPARKTA